MQVGELGGLHYCIVLNKDDKPSFGTLNVIPLTSIKENKTYYDNTINLGNEIYTTLYNKFQKKFNDTFDKLSSISNNKVENYDDIKDELEQIPALSQELEFLKKFENEISKMKKGSIALLNQITTISKQRIYYPKTSKDLLAGLHLSNSSLDLLDKKMSYQSAIKNKIMMSKNYNLRFRASLLSLVYLLKLAYYLKYF